MRTSKLTLVLLVFLLFPSVGKAAQANSTLISRANSIWNFSTVDSGNSVGFHNSIAIDPSNGQVWVAYFDQTASKLMYAFYAGEGFGNCGTNFEWSCGVADANAGRGVVNSIGIDPVTHNPAIAYYGSVEHDLFFVEYSCTAFGACAWGTPAVIDNSNDTDGDFVSLKFRPGEFGGKPAIAYHSTDPSHVYAGLVKYAQYIGAGGNCGGPSLKWDCQTVEADSTRDYFGKYVSLAFSSTNTASITYASPKISQWIATEIASGGNCGVTHFGTWKCEAVDFNPDPPLAPGATTERRYSSLAVGPGSIRQVAYAAYDPSTTGYLLMFATSNVTAGAGTCGENNFSCIAIDTIGGVSGEPQPLAIALDADGSPQIAYMKNGEMYFAEPAPGLVNGNCAPTKDGIPVYTWNCRHLAQPLVTLVQNIVGESVSIAVLASGLPIVLSSHYTDIPPKYTLDAAFMRFPLYIPVVVK